MNEKKIKLILKAFQLNGNDFKLETPSFVIINDHNLFVVSFYNNNNDDDDKILIYKNKTKGKNKKIKVDKKLDVDKLMKEIKKFIDSKSQKKIKEEERKKIIIEIQNDFSNKLISYHSNYLQKQEQLKKDFEYKKIDVININIYDDFYDDGFAPNEEEQNTYAYVDILNIPDIETKKILEILFEYITNNSLLPESVKIELNFYDSTTQYPFLVLEYENHLYKRWQIEFKNITHKILDKLIDDLQKIELSLNEVKFDIYSES